MPFRSKMRIFWYFEEKMLKKTRNKKLKLRAKILKSQGKETKLKEKTQPLRVLVLTLTPNWC